MLYYQLNLFCTSEYNLFCTVFQMVKRLFTMKETWVQSLDQKDLLEKEMTIHSSTLAWKIPWMEKPGRLYIVHGVAKSRTQLSDFIFTYFLMYSHLP